MDQYLTPKIVRQFGIAFGHWAYQMDLALLGRPQGDKPDLIGVEESDAYGAVVKMIEDQDAPRVEKQEVAGVMVYVEEQPSALYQVFREAMFAAYRQEASASAQTKEHR
jgi:hypothetical protein